MTKKILFVLAFLIFLAGLSQQLYRLYYVFQERDPIDFNVYWTAVQIAQNGENVYQKLPVDQIPPFNYPPTALLFLSPLSLFHKKLATWLFFLTSLFSLLAVVFVLIKLWFNKKWRWPLFFVLSGLFIQFFPTKFTFTLGQINLIVLLLTTLSFYFLVKKNETLAGIFLAIASLIKIFPAFLVIFFIKNKKPKALISFLVSTVIGVIITLLIFKPMLFLDYFGNVGKNLFFQAGTVFYDDQSLNSFLIRLSVDDSWRLFLRLAASFYLTWLFIGKKNLAVSYFGLIASITLILPSFAWFHHYVILIPVIILLLSGMSYKKGLKGQSFLAGFLILLSFLACFLHLKDPAVIKGSGFILRSHPFLGAVVLLGLLSRKNKLNLVKT